MVFRRVPFLVLRFEICRFNPLLIVRIIVDKNLSPYLNFDFTLTPEGGVFKRFYYGHIRVLKHSILSYHCYCDSVK